MNEKMDTDKAVLSAPAGSEPAIELLSVDKRFGEARILNDINLQIEPGEFFVLLGPSGCGKSTILKIIAGLEDATEGEVYIDGQLVNYAPPKERDIAMVFQNYALYPHMTVERNIGFPLKMRKVDKKVIHEKVEEVAQLLDMDMYLDKFPDQLSGGQRQRVALGRALIRNPIAFLLDEPLSNLDALLRIQMREELVKFHRRVGRTIIYVTHDQVEAMTMADRIVVLKSGVIQQVGKPLDVYMRPANTFVATFVGSPQMNLFKGTARLVDDEVCFSGPFTQPIGNQYAEHCNTAITLGIRPEDVGLCEDERDKNAVAGQVVRVEPVGSDVFVNVETGENNIVKARLPSSCSIREGENVRVSLPQEKLHLFGSEGFRIEIAV